MEKQKKVKKVLEIILLILAVLSIIFFPILNIFRDKTTSLNNTELTLNRDSVRFSNQLDANGNITISTNNQDIDTIFVNFTAFEIPRNTSLENRLMNEKSISGSSDDFGYNCTNYFRFVYNQEISNRISTDYENCYTLEYYIETDAYNIISIRLGYYELTFDDFIYFTPLSRGNLAHYGINLVHNVLNLLFYNPTSTENFWGFMDETFDYKLLHNGFNYQVTKEFKDNTDFYATTKFVIIDQDFFSALIKDAYDRGKDDGFSEGVSTSGSYTGVFDMLYRAANSIGAILSIEVFPNISLWLLISIPLSISIMIIIFKLLRGDN